jgi:hypothetical protein
VVHAGGGRQRLGAGRRQLERVTDGAEIELQSREDLGELVVLLAREPGALALAHALEPFGERAQRLAILLRDRHAARQLGVRLDERGCPAGDFHLESLDELLLIEMKGDELRKQRAHAYDVGPVDRRGPWIDGAERAEELAVAQDDRTEM